MKEAAAFMPLLAPSSSIKLLFVVLAGLISHRAGCLTCGLAGRLTLAASALLHRVLQGLRIQSLHMLHLLFPPRSFLQMNRVSIAHSFAVCQAVPESYAIALFLRVNTQASGRRKTKRWGSAPSPRLWLRTLSAARSAEFESRSGIHSKSPFQGIRKPRYMLISRGF